MSQAFNVARVESNSMPHCACARDRASPLPSPGLFPARPRPSLLRAYPRSIHSFPSLFPSSLSVRRPLPPHGPSIPPCSPYGVTRCRPVAASRDRKTFPVLAFLGSIYKNFLYTPSLSTDGFSTETERLSAADFTFPRHSRLLADVQSVQDVWLIRFLLGPHLLVISRH